MAPTSKALLLGKGGEGGGEERGGEERGGKERGGGGGGRGGRGGGGWGREEGQGRGPLISPDTPLLRNPRKKPESIADGQSIGGTPIPMPHPYQTLWCLCPPAYIFWNLY
jgi:hypothetical protein